MEKHKIKTLAELRKARKPIPDVNLQHKQKLSVLDKFALIMTEKVGSMGFFIIIFLWTTIWLMWNTLGPDYYRFDPYPAFVMWLFISNMIQIFLMPLILVGQNLLSAHSEARAQSDFDVNTKAEIEIETILQHLENQSRQIEKLLSDIEELKTIKKA